MSKKPNILSVLAGFLSSRTINENFTRIADAFDNTLSRDGSLPNHMNADFDMNSNDILNVKEISADTASVKELLISGEDSAHLKNWAREAEQSAKISEEAAVDSVGAAELAVSIVGAGATMFSTQEAVKNVVIPPFFTHLQTAGYSELGDGGGAYYKRVGVEPKHKGKIQSADGSWWELAEVEVTVEMFGAKGDGKADDAPAFRDCRDFLLEKGGGTILAPKRTYSFRSVEQAVYYEIKSSAPPEVVLKPVFLTLQENINLKGGGKKHTKFVMYNVDSVHFGIFLQDYSNGFLSDFELEGFGAVEGNFHGIFFGPSEDYLNISENITLENLFVHDVSSYGIGQNMQLDKVRLKNIDVHDTGSDGIDWKVRGPQVQGIVTRGVFMENITIRRFGLRLPGGTSSGIGVRGTASLNNISVYEIPDEMVGIDFVPGVALGDTEDFRQSSSMSNLSNWYCEGASRKGTAIAVQVWSSFAVNVGQGVARWASVLAIPGSATPYHYDDGPLFHDVVCIPAHGREGFKTTDNGTSFSNCRVMADKIYFDTRRGNLVDGQTVFGLQEYEGTSTSNNANRYVVKNGVALTEGPDFSWNPNSITLTSPVTANDTIIIIFAPFRSIRIEALYCSVEIRIDRWSPWVSIGTEPQFSTSNIDVVWDGNPGITRVNSSGLAGIQASSGVPGKSQPLRLAGVEGELVEIDKPRIINVPTSPEGLKTGQIWRDGDLVKVV